MYQMKPCLTPWQYITLYICLAIYKFSRSIPIKESVCVCVTQITSHFFAGLFSTPHKSSRTTASLPYTFNVHGTFGERGYALGAQVRRYAENPTSGIPHAFHNALTIVRAAPNWPTQEVHKNYVITDFWRPDKQEKREVASISCSEHGTDGLKKFMYSYSRPKLCIIWSECHLGRVEGLVLTEFLY